jgi:multidrug resistance efflux pump
MTALVTKVLVKEGSVVQAGQTLALLDSRELEFKIKNAERQIQLLASEMEYLQGQAAHGQMAKLAERDLVELKQQAAQAELTFLRSQRAFLELKAPVAGTVMTRDVESLAGKKLSAGEPFCEILAAGELVADVLVPEDRISHVKSGQALILYLDTDPRTGLPLAVEEVAPKAEIIPRLGSVFRVRAAFQTPHPPVMPGMKGIGKVQIRTATVWSVVRERAARIWRRFSLYFC